MPRSRNRSYLQTTVSVCPTCLRSVNGQVFVEAERVYMRKFCPEHGHTEELLSSDAAWYRDTLRIEYTPELPRRFTAQVRQGCPDDCGICSDHQQRCMIPVVEITDHCNMECPICFADNRKQKMMSDDEFELCLQSIRRTAGDDVDLLVISGGEPTLHPRLFELLERAVARGFRNITVNTNGLKLAEDLGLAKRAAKLGVGFSVWLDGFREATHLALRGKDLRAEKERALAHLEQAGVTTGLVMVVAQDVNEAEVGDVLRFAVRSPAISSLAFHVLAYTGRGGSRFQRDPRRVVTLPDIMRLIEEQSGFLGQRDFSPIPAPHPLCESATYLLMPDDGGDPIPVPRLLPRDECLRQAENTAILTPDERLEERVRSMIDQLYAAPPTEERRRALAFFRALLDRCFPKDGHTTAAEREAICKQSMKVIILVPYMDAHNFDLTRLRSCVSMQALPDGRLIPSCAYFAMYRQREQRAGA